MENNKKGDIVKNVKTLLEVSPDIRDNDGELSMSYLFHFWNGTKEDFIMDRMPSKIERTRRELQHNNPKLRGEYYEARQIHAKKIREEKHRNLGQYEDCSNIFEPIRIKKETYLQFVIRKLSNLW